MADRNSNEFCRNCDYVTFDINNENKFDLWKKMASRSVADFQYIPLQEILKISQNDNQNSKKFADIVTGIL